MQELKELLPEELEPKILLDELSRSNSRTFSKFFKEAHTRMRTGEIPLGEFRDALLQGVQNWNAEKELIHKSNLPEIPLREGDQLIIFGYIIPALGVDPKTVRRSISDPSPLVGIAFSIEDTRKKLPANET